jgi:hypothetical protein
VVDPARGLVYGSELPTGRLYAHDVARIGQATTDAHGVTWVFHVNPSRTRAYLMTRRGKFFVTDLGSGRVVRRLDFHLADPALAGRWFYGHDAWDRHGRFHFASFKQLAELTGVRLVAFDPARFLAAARAAAPGWAGRRSSRRPRGARLARGVRGGRPHLRPGSLAHRRSRSDARWRRVRRHGMAATEEVLASDAPWTAVRRCPSPRSPSWRSRSRSSTPRRR